MKLTTLIFFSASLAVGHVLPGPKKSLAGVGPQAADDRWFDWDESCSDWTSKHLDQLKAGLPNAVGTSVNAANRKYIFEKDPAFAQMFLGQDNRIQYIKETFDLVTTNAKKPPGERGGNKPGALRFICSAKNEVEDIDGQPYCG